MCYLNFIELCSVTKIFKEFDLNKLVWEEVFPEGIDSSKMVPQKWNNLAMIINERRPHYRGIVVIHGSDTLMYTTAGETF